MSSVADERVFAEIKRLCCAGIEGSALLSAVLRCMRRVVPFEAYCACTTDPASGLATRGQYEEMGSAETATLFFERHYFEHQVERLRQMSRERRPVELLSEDTKGRLERSPYYREILVPLGYTYRALSVFTTGRAIWGSVDLAREAGRPDFAPHEAALLKRLAPHVSVGLKVAALRAQASLQEQEQDADVPGVLTLDRRGRVIQHTPSAERWLREIEELKSGWQEDAPLAVRTVSAVLQRALHSETDKDLNNSPRLRIRARSGRWLTLYGSLTAPDSADNPGDTIVVIEPARLEEVAWLNAAAYGLSPREDELVKLVMRGASTKQIAASLYISENTVQNHLSHVFEKVGVRSRRECVKRLFFDHLYPSLLG